MIDFMLESLHDEQNTLLKLMEKAHKANIPEVWSLQFALEDAVTGLRRLRTGEIGWQAAAQIYQAVTRAESECQMALTYHELFTSGFEVRWRSAEVTP